MKQVAEFLERFSPKSKFSAKSKKPAIDWTCGLCLEFRDAHVESQLSSGVWRQWRIHINRDHAKTSKARKALIGF